MNATEYLKESARTDQPGTFERQIMHGILGIASESGELSDNLKRHMYYGQELDVPNIMEECGDLMWYIALLCRTCGKSLEEVMEANIEKLRRRFPEGFTEEKVLNRNLASEREVFDVR